MGKLKELNHQKPKEAAIQFKLAGESVLEFKHNGQVFVRGELVDDNKEIYKAVKEFLMQTGNLTQSKT